MPRNPATYSRLARATRLYLAANGLDQSALVEAWGCSESTVSRFLRGLGMPEAQTVARMLVWFLDTDGCTTETRCAVGRPLTERKPQPTRLP